MERNLTPNLTLVFYVQSLMNAVKVLKFESPKQNEETSQPSCFNLEVKCSNRMVTAKSGAHGTCKNDSRYPIRV